jgi:hypothetical protein
LHQVFTPNLGISHSVFSVSSVAKFLDIHAARGLNGKEMPEYVGAPEADNASANAIVNSVGFVYRNNLS